MSHFKSHVLVMKIPLLVCICLLLTKPSKGEVRTCKNPVYCQGDLLRVIQMAGIFKDSKTFVDMSLIRSTDKTLKSFDKLMGRTHGNPSREEIIEFLNKNFQASANELEHWHPTDYKDNPPFLKKIQDGKIRNFAKRLHDIWPTLGRRVKREVIQNPEKYSIIPINNGFIVPGGRFREFYYWDSYWIVKGLLISNMKRTAKGKIENFLKIVETYGFVPNGGRVYYLDRSQPPVLTMMVSDYLEVTKDYSFLKSNIQILEQELNYWVESKIKVIHIDKSGHLYTMFRYHSYDNTPRPESFIEDIQTASKFRTEDEKRQCYTNIRTGAETGWDFSGRWFFDSEGGNRGDLSTINPTRLIPVDLNAFLCKSFKIMHDFYLKVHDKQKAKYWLQQHQELKNAIHEVLYNPEDGIWYDYDIELQVQRRHYYSSNFAPLWAESYNTSDKDLHGRNAVNYLKMQGILDYEGGIPASVQDTGEQWDLPNAWAPLQTIVILGLEKTEDAFAQKIAHELALKWINSLIQVAHDTNEMFEKYNAMLKGMYGGGGEYEVQTGFGWTNGVLLELIEHYFIKRKAEQESDRL